MIYLMLLLLGRFFQAARDNGQNQLFQRQQLQTAFPSSGLNSDRSSLFQQLNFNRGTNLSKVGKNAGLFQFRSFPEEQDVGLFNKPNITPATATRPLTIKSITNPLLQNLFNRKSIALLNVPNSSQNSENPISAANSSPDTLNIFQEMNNRMKSEQKKTAREESRQLSNDRETTRSLTSILDLRDEMLKRKSQNKNVLKTTELDTENRENSFDLKLSLFSENPVGKVLQLLRLKILLFFRL